MLFLIRVKLFKIEFIRFLLIGIINTLLGLSVIFILIYFNINNYLANLIGYLVGLVFSFLLHKHYTFNNKTKTIKKQIIIFIVVFLVSYSINFYILYISLEYVSKYIAQIMALIAYTFVSYLLNKFITFKD